MYIKRVASSTNRLTAGKIYECTNGAILDDNGNTMRPSLKTSAYWEHVPGVPTITNPTTTESTMLKIETVTLINGQRLTDFKADTLIGYIQKEEAHIDALQEVRAVSKAITKLKARHQNNIKALITILDDMDDDSE